MIDRSHVLRAAAVAAIALAGCHSNSGQANSMNGIPGARTVGPGGSAVVGNDGFGSARHDPPIAVETRVAAGQLAESQGNLAQAAEQYRQAVALDPNNADAVFRLGTALAQLKKYPEAIAVWKKYIKVTGESGAAYANLAFCYELARRPEDAEQTYQKGIAKDPTSGPCHVNYGLMLVRRGRVGEGRLQLAAVLKPAEVHYNVGSVYESQGRKEQARAEYREALALDPQFADATTRLNELAGVRATAPVVPQSEPQPQSVPEPQAEAPPQPSAEPELQVQPEAEAGLPQEE